MTHTHALAAKITSAVIDRIATDRMCNSANIGDAVVKELAVASLSPSPGSADPVRTATENLIRLVLSKPSLTFNTHSDLDAALEKVYRALLSTGWKP